MNLSAVVLDIDGTLLNSQRHISDANLAALQECARKGIVLYVATARPKRLVFRLYEVSEDVSFLTDRGVFYNGAMAIDRELDHIGHWPLSAELVGFITSYLADAVPDIQIAIQYKDDYHSFRQPVDDEMLEGWGFAREELIPFSEACQCECSKIVAGHETRNLSDVYHELLEQCGDRSSMFLTDSDLWLQFMSSKASKENALLELLSLRGISPEEVVVFGDDMPDLGMFRTFGCSVAMANAKEPLKEAATYVTRSNDEDGVAFALEKYLGIL
ncbi:HAD-IIB family hydrolase [Candidatus Poribacteria bacterium]